MLFNSFIFFIFLGIVFPIFHFLPTKRSKNLFLLLSSYFFYGYWDWRFCLLLLLSTLVDYSVGQAMAKTSNILVKRRLLSLSLISNLGILGFFKYFNFFVDSFESLANSFGIHIDDLHLGIILPVGISFYTFQTLSYTIDIYRDRLSPTKDFIDFALFVAFFPQLVAGPIERASSLLPQLSKKLKASRSQINEGVILIITGLFRKVIIGDTAGRYVDHVFGNLELYRSIELISALLLFSVQIYADFSGYSKIARGTAKLLGVELMVNFQQPYLSRNITEFWRRWHISLSTWLRDYLYISLGGNRMGRYRTYMNLMITMLLGGLWHGASWNFVVWGGLHGMYLAIHKLSLGSKKRVEDRISRLDFSSLIKIAFTFILVLFTWLFFRSTSWESTTLFFSRIIHWEHSEYTTLFVSITCVYLVSTLLWDIIEYKFQSHTRYLEFRNPWIKYGILTSMFTVTLIYMFQADPLPFIYFQF